MVSRLRWLMMRILFSWLRFVKVELGGWGCQSDLEFSIDISWGYCSQAVHAWYGGEDGEGDLWG